MISRYFKANISESDLIINQQPSLDETGPSNTVENKLIESWYTECTIFQV